MKSDSARLPVLKTYKLFLGGTFPRSESGRTLPVRKGNDGHVAHVCRASRKDLRDAVQSAQAAQPGWAKASAYLRGQILYRIAEMFESRRANVVRELVGCGATEPKAAAEVDCAIDRLVYFAGWSDKLSSLYGSVNPVASPHWNVTAPEPVGVVAVLAPDEPGLAGLVSLLAPCVVTGNAAVAIPSASSPLAAIAFAEAVATSDVPPGVVNILTGVRKELAPVLAEHMAVDAIVDGSNDGAIATELEAGAARNLKRVRLVHRSPKGWLSADPESAEPILDTVEFKTTWHPAGL